MDKYKFFVKGFLLLSIIFIILFGFINYIVDPYQQFRISKFYNIYYGGNERYLIPGLAKNANYQDVVLGSSMTENFKVNNVEKILNYSKVIKLPLEGATSFEINEVLKVIFTHKKNIHHILYGLDFFAFSGPLNRTKISPFPTYMYNDNLLNKYRYLLNIDTLKASLMIPIRKLLKKNDPKYTYNTMFQWQHLYKKKDFSKKKLLNEWHNRNVLYKNNYLKKDYKLNILIKHFEKHIYPYIINHPNVHFDIFLPPYSILTYKLMLEKGVLNNIILFKMYLYQKLSEQKNVTFYDFQLNNNIINNLYNYRDIAHYSQNISLWILKSIRCKRNTFNNIAKYGIALNLWKNDIINYRIKK